MSFFFFNDTATTEIYTLSLHDALPISIPTNTERCGDRDHHLFRGRPVPRRRIHHHAARKLHRPGERHRLHELGEEGDRKSTRLNSSHQIISYAVFCLKKKKNPTSRNSQ